jgi:hypothetical protein
MEKSLKQTAINYGIYLGLILSSITVVAYAVSLDLFTKWWYGIILLLLVVVVGVISSAKAKGILGGFMSFKQAFSSYFIAVAVGVIISAGVSMLLFNVVDTEAAEIVKEKTIEAQVKMLEGFGAPKQAIDDAVTELRNTNQFSVVSLLKAIAGQLVFFSVIGLIVALIMKKKDPNLE